MNFEFTSTHALAAGVILALMLVWRWTLTHPLFDLSDILTGDNGKVSGSKAFVAGAFVVSSWGFIVQVQHNQLTEFYLGIYMAAWAGYRIANNVTSKPPEPTQ